MKNLKKTMLTAVLTALMLSMATTAHGQKLPECFGLSVGIDKYPAPAALHGPVKDAKDTQALFQSQQGKLFGKVDWAQSLDTDASKTNVVAKLNAWASQPKPGDVAVLSLAGHGARDGDGWYFLCQDMQLLRDHEIISVVAKLTARGVKVIVVIDSCHSGAIRYAAKPQLEGNGSQSDGGLILILGCGPQELCGEAWGNGILTKALLEGLNGSADRNNDGNITLAEIRLYTHNRVEELTKLRQKGTKLPGVSREEQHADVVHSLTISDSLVVAKATKIEAPAKIETPKTEVPAKMTGPEGSTQKPRGESQDRSQAGKLEGQWKVVYKVKDRTGTLRDQTYTIDFYVGGRYSARTPDQNKPTMGKFQNQGNQLLLISDNDRDEMTITWVDANKFTATLDGKTYTFERAN